MIHLHSCFRCRWLVVGCWPIERRTPSRPTRKHLLPLSATHVSVTCSLVFYVFYLAFSTKCFPLAHLDTISCINNCLFVSLFSGIFSSRPLVHFSYFPTHHQQRTTYNVSSLFCLFSETLPSWAITNTYMLLKPISLARFTI